MIPNQFEGKSPKIAKSCYIHESAVVIGDVAIGADSSVWPLTSIRGDVNKIRIGSGSNIQDASVLHASHASAFNPEGAELHLGDQVTVGHKALLHGCSIANLCLIGMGAIVMDHVIVESQVIIAAGALVPPGKVLLSGHLYVGNPARKVRTLRKDEKDFLSYTADYYVTLKNRY